MKKRILFVLLACVLACGCLLAGCNRPGQKETQIPVEPLKATEISIAFRSAEEPTDKDNVVRAINEKLAEDGKPYTVAFKFLAETNYITQMENGGSQKTIDAAFIHISDYASLISRQTLMNIQPYLQEYGKNLLAGSPKYAWAQVTDYKTGNIYAIPRNVPMADFEWSVDVRKDWMQAVGMTEINTVEDYVEYCTKIKNYEGIGKENGAPRPSFYPNLAEHYNEFILRELSPKYYFPIKSYANRPVYIDMTAPNENGSYTVGNFYTSDVYEEWADISYDFAHSYAIAPEDGYGVVAGGDEYNFAKGNIGSVWSTVLRTSERMESFLLDAEKIDSGAADPQIENVYLNKNFKKQVMQAADNMMAVMAKSTKPNEVVDFFNWVRSSQENYDLVCYGVEGQNFVAKSKTLTINGKEQEVQYMSFRKGDGTWIPQNKRYSVNMPYWTITDMRFNRWSDNLEDEYIISRYEWETDDENGKPLNYEVSPLVGLVFDYSSTEMTTARDGVMAALATAPPILHGIKGLNDKYNDQFTEYQYLLNQLNAGGYMNTLLSGLQKQVDDYMKWYNANKPF